MSEEENFIARWSRRKREAESDGGPPKSPTAERPEAPGAFDRPDGAKPAPLQGREEPADPPIDLASLPPLESITAGTDIRAFLQAGVPAELTKAALRRAWAADPAIRDFIEIAENQWDFANPASIPGFGPLRASDDIKQLVSQALGGLGREATAGIGDIGDDANVGSEPVWDQPKVPPEPAAASSPSSASDSYLEQPKVSENQIPDKRPITAVQHDASPAGRAPMPNRRTHGGALPQ